MAVGTTVGAKPLLILTGGKVGMAIWGWWVGATEVACEGAEVVTYEGDEVLAYEGDEVLAYEGDEVVAYEGDRVADGGDEVLAYEGDELLGSVRLAVLGDADGVREIGVWVDGNKVGDFEWGSGAAVEGAVEGLEVVETDGLNDGFFVGDFDK